MCAAAEGNTLVVRLLLERGNIAVNAGDDARSFSWHNETTYGFGMTALMIAAEGRKAEVVDALLKRDDVDVTARVRRDLQKKGQQRAGKGSRNEHKDREKRKLASSVKASSSGGGWG